MGIPTGFGFIPGRSREKAIELLEAAERAGEDPATSVQTVKDGYYVKDEVIASIDEDYDAEDAAINADDPIAEDRKQIRKAERKASTFAPVSIANEVVETETPAEEEIVQSLNGSATIVEGEKVTEAETETEPAAIVTDANGETIGDGETIGTLPVDQSAAPVAEAATEAPASEDDTVAPVEYPAGNADTDTWLAFAKTRPGYSEADDAELGRNELKAKFGPQV